MRRTVLLHVLGMAAVATALAAPGTIAHADAGHIGLSHDGRTWQPSLRAPVLDPDRRWVPGESGRESFYVRNQGPTSGRLTVNVVAGDGGDLLDGIRLRARVAGAGWQPLRNGSPSATLTQAVLEREGVTRVDLAISYRWDESNATQTRTVPSELVVRLEQSESGDGDGDGAGELPGAGSVVPPWALWLAAILIGVGLAMVLRRERGRRG